MTHLLQPAISSWWSARRSDVANLLTIAGIWTAMIVLANPLGDFPLNDDWVYALAVKSVLETGYFQFPSGTLANVGPQVYWGALFCLPFGFSFTALRFSTLIIGLAGVIALYALIREVGGDRKTALVGALVLAVNPLYFGLANSFMTDVPFVALVIVATHFLARGLRRDSTLDLALGVLVSLTAILVRQLSLVVLLAFAVAYPIKNGFRPANLAKAILPVVIGALLHVAYQRWLLDTGRIPTTQLSSGIQGLIPTSLGGFALTSLRESTIALIYIGLFALPFAAAFLPSRPSELTKEQLNRLRIVVVAFAVTVLVAIAWKHTTMPLSENGLIKSGLGPMLLRDTAVLGINYPTRPPAIDRFWVVATVLAVAGACSVIFYLVLGTHRAAADFRKTKTRPETWFYSLIAVMAAVYMVILLIVADRFTDGHLFDRYLLLLLPLFILLASKVELARTAPVRHARMTLAVALVVFYAGFSTAAAHDYLAWNRSRWIALHSLIDGGKVSPSRIDGGYEFNGWFLYDAKYTKKPGKSWWWVTDDEYIIASGPLPGYVEVRRYTFTRWLLFSESSILILRRSTGDE